MQTSEETYQCLAAIPYVQVERNVALARYTRFATGGPADILAETAEEQSFIQALRVARDSGLPVAVLGGGANVVAADAGFRGVVLRFTASALSAEGSRVTAQAGAELEDLVNFSIERGLGGLETLAGVPGSVGGAVYGNAGAYGHSISERVTRVRFCDFCAVRELDAAGCDFHYRDSVFKRRKDWVIFSVELSLEPAAAEELRRVADEILEVRSRKFPATMKCAGSVFKNLLACELPAAAAAAVPPEAVRDGKVAAAFFLERVGAKGMRRGGMRVADYHANLIYNKRDGTAADLRALIGELKARVRERFGLELEEEVQYVGF